MSTKEIAPQQQEQAPEAAEREVVNQDQHEALQDARERAAERDTQSAESSVDSARKETKEALEKAGSHEKAATDTKREHSPAERRRGPIGKREREQSYKTAMKEIQTHMSPAEKAFSKFIHNPVVDQVSEGLGNTVARPNAILAGAVAAFLFSLATLLIAKHFGYRLSGFEAIAAFIAGWLIGILYDFFRVMITGTK